MYQTETQIRVRYAETDQMGYVYYGNYATFYEVGRVESLRQLGLSYKALEEKGVMMPVRESRSRFIQPARYDELLTIKVTIRELPGVKIVFEYDILNEKGTKIHVGETTLVFVNMKDGRLCRCPEAMITLLQPFFIKNES